MDRHGGLLPEVDVLLEHNDVDQRDDHDLEGRDDEDVLEEAGEEGDQPVDGALVSQAEAVQRHHPGTAQGHGHGQGPG